MPDATPPRVLKQNQEWRETLELSLQDDELSAVFRQGQSEHKMRVPVERIDDLTWETQNVKGNGMLAGAVVVGVLAVVALVLCAVEVGRRGGITTTVAVVGLAVALPLAVTAAMLARAGGRMARRTYHQLFNNETGEPFLAVRSDDPSRGEVDLFLAGLLADAKRLSDETEEQAWLSSSRLHAPREIRRFHDLMRGGVLTPDEFAAKKRALLAGFLAE